MSGENIATFNPEEFVEDVMSGGTQVACEPVKPDDLHSRLLDTIFTANDLSMASFPDINYVVPGYLPEGLTILAGKPKRGKSWMALDIACAVAFGGHAFGSIECKQGDVLYLALEDNKRRLQKRLEQLLGDKAWPSLLGLQIEWPLLEQGGLKLIRDWMERVSNPRLIIVDTFQKVRTPRSGAQSYYEADYAAATPLQKLAGEHGIAILVIHHLRKGDAEDPLDTVSGSTGLTGAADTVLVLANDEQGYTTLYGRGRDIEEIETAIEFDKVTGLWSLLGPAEDVRRSDTRSQILDLMLEHGGPMQPKQVADQIDMLTEPNARQTMRRMALDGDIKKVGPGKYEAM